jgi:lipoate-protein ligase A
MYAVVLGYDRHPHLRAIDAAHAHVLGLLAGELNRYLPGVQCAGTSDLAIEGRKFSGNSLRCRRDHFLYHGTLLYDFRLSLLDELLLMPPRLPEYRRGRSHGQFVANLSLSARVLRQAVAHAFAANAAVTCWPEETVRRLAAEKYSRAAWNEVR